MVREMCAGDKDLKRFSVFLLAQACQPEIAAADAAHTSGSQISVALLFIGAPGWRNAARVPVGAVFSYALPVPTSPAGLLAACVARQSGSLGPIPLPPPLYVLEGRADLNTNAWATSKFGGGEWGVRLLCVIAVTESSNAILQLLLSATLRA